VSGSTRRAPSGVATGEESRKLTAWGFRRRRRDASRAAVFAASIAAGCRKNSSSVKLAEAEKYGSTRRYPKEPQRPAPRAFAFTRRTSSVCELTRDTNGI
jgi:hypothetical protein